MSIHFILLFILFIQLNIDTIILLIMQNKEAISSIKQLLAYFNSSKQQIFCIGRMYCNCLLSLQNHLQNYKVITCFDPFKQRHPCVIIPDSIKNAKVPHICKDLSQCILTLLRDPEVIRQLTKNSKSPNVMLAYSDIESQRICKENSFKVWGPTTQTQNWLSNKVEIVKLLKDINIPFIPNVCSKIKSYDHLLELALPFNTNKLVVQAEDGGSGFGTYFILSKEDYQKISNQLEDNRPKKIMPFKKLRSFGIGVVAGRFGTALGPMHSELIGHKKLTPNLGGFCGNQLRKDYFEDEETQKEVRRKIYQIAERFGDHLYQKGFYKGYFGIDFVVDANTYEVYFMEINPRQTACTTLSLQYYNAEGQNFSLFLLNCSEHLGLPLNLNIKAFNKYWEQASSYEINSCHIAFKHMYPEQMNQISDAQSGIWVIEEGKLKFTGKFTFIVSEMTDDEIFFTPSQGFAKGHLIVKRKCMDYDGKLYPQMQEIVDKFLTLIKNTIK